MKVKNDLQMNEFCFFKLSESFVEKQKSQTFFLLEIIKLFKA